MSKNKTRQQAAAQFKAAQEKFERNAGTTQSGITAKLGKKGSVDISFKKTKTANERRNQREAIKDMIKSGARFVFNHPEWYTQDNVLEFAPVGLNYAYNKAGRPFANASEGTIGDKFDNSPALVSAMWLLLGNAALADDDSSFDELINRRILELSSNSGRVVNYTPSVLAAYELNCRTITAAICQAIRTWTFGFHVDPADTSMPAVLMRASGIDSFKDSANYRDRLRTIVHKFFSIYPMVGTAIDRTMWLFSNVFPDYQGTKPTYYVPMLQAPTILYRREDDTWGKQGYTGAAFNGALANTMDFATMLDNIDSMLQLMRKFYGASQLLADYLRVFGLSKSLEVEGHLLSIIDATIPEISVVHDPYLLNQISNAQFLDYQYMIATDSTVIGNADYVNHIFDAETGRIGFRAYNGNTGATQELVEYFNSVKATQLVNGEGADPSNGGEQLSITRLAPTIRAELIEVSGVDVMATYPVTQGTEVPFTMVYYYSNVANNSGEFSRVRVGNHAILVVTDKARAFKINFELLNTIQVISTADDHPFWSIVGVINTPDIRGSINIPVWDFAMYARLPLETARSMNNVALTSLLYSGKEVTPFSKSFKANV